MIERIVQVGTIASFEGEGGPGGQGRQFGGLITGPLGVDNILTPLTAGEFVIRRDAVSSLGIPFLEALNTGRVDKGRMMEGAKQGQRMLNETVAIRKQLEQQGADLVRLNKTLARRR